MKKIPKSVLLLIYLVSYVGLTFFLFRDDRPADGALSLGIPFPFYYGGGFCRSDCGPDIVILGVLLDILVFLVPIFLFYFFSRKRNSK